MDFDPYLFIRKLPPLDSVVTPIREVLLPRQVCMCQSFLITSTSSSSSSMLWFIAGMPGRFS